MSFRDLIRDELERSVILEEIEAVRQEKKTRPWPLALASHPLTITVVGFILTGLIGVALEQRVSDRVDLRERKRAEVAGILAEERTAQANVIQLKTQLIERTTRGQMLVSSIRRGDVKEAEARKLLYDEAYFRWNASLSSNLVEIRQHVVDGDGIPMVRQTLYEDYVYVDVVIALSRMDRCLTKAYDAFRVGSLEGLLCSDKNWEKQVETQGELARDCAYGIVQDAFRYFREVARSQIAKVDNVMLPFPVPDETALRQVCRTVQR